MLLCRYYESNGCVLVSEWVKINGLFVNVFGGWNMKFVRCLLFCCCWFYVWRSLFIVVRYGVSVWSGYRIVREVGSSIIRCMLMLCWKCMLIFLCR